VRVKPFIDEHIGVLDFETDPFRAGRIPYPFACGIYFSDEKYFLFWDADCDLQVVKFLKKLPACTLYAHNGGKFDFFYLLDHANNGSIQVRNERVFEMQIGNVTLRDSWPLIPFALDQYRKVKIDYRIFEYPLRERRANKIKIQHYLFEDCKSLYELITGFHAIVGPKDTIGSAAFYQMRKLGIEIESLNEAHDATFRPFFYGGHVEAFGKGIFNGYPYKYLDVNSAYPFAMLHNHPHGADYRHQKTLKGIREIGPCFIEMVARSDGALPYRADDGGLCFPRGEYRFTATGWEYAAGIETKTLRVQEILNVWIPQRLISFAPFVNHFYPLRLQSKRDGNRIAYLAYKYLLNSGYGKFAQNPRDFKEHVLARFGEMPPDDSWKWETDYGALSLWSRPAYDGHGFYDVATGASITGFQRAVLWRAICDATDVLYCDTDAMICRDAKVKIGDALGEWKLEGIVHEACIAGKKLYAVKSDGEKCFDGKDYKLAHKGARLTYAQLKKICGGKEILWTSEAPTFSAGSGAHFVKRRIRST